MIVQAANASARTNQLLGGERHLLIALRGAELVLDEASDHGAAEVAAGSNQIPETDGVLRVGSTQDSNSRDLQGVASLRVPLGRLSPAASSSQTASILLMGAEAAIERIGPYQCINSYYRRGKRVPFPGDIFHPRYYANRYLNS